MDDLETRIAKAIDPGAWEATHREAACAPRSMNADERRAHVLAGKERRRVAAVVAAERALSVMSAERDELLEALEAVVSDLAEEASDGEDSKPFFAPEELPSMIQARAILAKHRGAEKKEG